MTDHRIDMTVPRWDLTRRTGLPRMLLAPEEGLPAERDTAFACVLAVLAGATR